MLAGTKTKEVVAGWWGWVVLVVVGVSGEWEGIIYI